MPVTSTPPKFEQYHTPGVTSTYRNYRYIPLCSALIHRRPKPVLSRDPLQRVLQSECTPFPKKVRIMSAQEGHIDSRIPTAACMWQKETLDLLNADYDIESVTPYKFNESLSLPSKLEKGMTACVKSAKYSHRPDFRSTCNGQ